MANLALCCSNTTPAGARKLPPYMADLEVLAHEQVERGAGVDADGADAAAAVSQKPQAEVGTELSVFLEKQLWELPQAPERSCSAHSDLGLCFDPVK